jgi:hypothetical protein
MIIVHTQGKPASGHSVRPQAAQRKALANSRNWNLRGLGEVSPNDNDQEWILGKRYLLDQKYMDHQH